MHNIQQLLIILHVLDPVRLRMRGKEKPSKGESLLELSRHKKPQNSISREEFKFENFLTQNITANNSAFLAC